MESFYIVPFAIDTVGAFTIGGIVGGMLRNLFKLLGFIIGLQIALFTYFDHLDFIEIKWLNIESRINIIIDSILLLQKPDSVSQDVFFDTLGIFGGFALGFLIGFKYG